MDITKFCSKEKTDREYFKKPFLLDDKIIAVDGRSMVVIPQNGCRLDLCEKRPHDGIEESIKKILSDAENLSFKPKSFVKNQIGTICKHCRGIGKLHTERCEECDGDGELRFESTHNTYYVDCDSCCGNGDRSYPSLYGKDTCPTCGGLGAEFNPVMVDGLNFRMEYLSRIFDIKGLEISVLPEKYLLHFRGEKKVRGVIMGLHE